MVAAVFKLSRTSEQVVDPFVVRVNPLFLSVNQLVRALSFVLPASINVDSLKFEGSEGELLDSGFRLDAMIGSETGMTIPGLLS